ncbi:hydroxyacylglutathione hydrolase [Methylomonas sp. UP202]|nr:hydroxyacylglutathione hydrolase [Methylomonas sp. UP202]WGS84963.1 hydroxyacylglutathione hydrolase [Methylomonas sp. UP202]
MLEILLLPALTDNYIYLLHDPADGATAAVDPAEPEPVEAALQARGWRLNYIFNTHHHGDHVGGNLSLKRSSGCRIVGAAGDRARIPGLDLAVEDGSPFNLGRERVQVIATPGHTSGHIAFYCPDSSALFCGDTLFSLGCGRLFEGSAEQLWQSLQRFKTLPPETRIYCAHEYTEANARFAVEVDFDNPALRRRQTEVIALRQAGQPTLPSTMAQELATNPFLREQDPAIQRHLGLTGRPAPAVFAELRGLKDRFR